MVNALAYFDMATITALKSYKLKAQGTNVNNVNVKQIAFLPSITAQNIANVNESLALTHGDILGCLHCGENRSKLGFYSMWKIFFVL